MGHHLIHQEVFFPKEQSLNSLIESKAHLIHQISNTFRRVSLGIHLTSSINSYQLLFFPFIFTIFLTLIASHLLQFFFSFLTKWRETKIHTWTTSVHQLWIDLVVKNKFNSGWSCLLKNFLWVFLTLNVVELLGLPDEISGSVVAWRFKESLVK